MTDAIYCRLCFNKSDNLSPISDKVRENFHYLTNIHLLESIIHSNLICADCEVSLRSTSQYAKILAENETQLMNKIHKTSSDDENLQNKASQPVCSKKTSPRKRKLSKLSELILPKHLQVTPNGKVICNDCNRPIFKANYVQHMEKMHTVSNRYVCDLCPKTLTHKDSLLCHMYVHLKIQPYVCPENCGKSFYSKHGMYFHHKMHHQPLNEFICEICAKQFKQSHLLQEHIDAKHSGVRYTCKYEGCGNEYHTVNALRKHVSSIHEWRLESCEFCGEKFRTGFSMYQHVRINHKARKYACDYENCGKKFAIKTHFTDHLKMHVGKKDFICHICDASYHVKRNLTRHVQVVHQKSRFYCQVDGCGASLCNKDNYRAHLRKVHVNCEGVEKLLQGVARLKPVFLDGGDVDG